MRCGVPVPQFPQVGRGLLQEPEAVPGAAPPCPALPRPHGGSRVRSAPHVSLSPQKKKDYEIELLRFLEVSGIPGCSPACCAAPAAVVLECKAWGGGELTLQGFGARGGGAVSAALPASCFLPPA